MKKFAKTAVLAAVLIIACAVLAGCSGKKEKGSKDAWEAIPGMEAKAEDKADSGKKEDGGVLGQIAEQAESAAGKAEADQKTGTASGSGADGFSFADVADREFTFASGAGGWSTELYVGEDGSFKGNFHDSDMGSTGPGYPNGSLYLCSFSGQFSAPVKVNDYTFEVGIDEIRYEQKSGSEEIKDDIRYIYTTPYGLDGGETFYFYLPSAPVREMTEDFLSWVHGSIPEYDSTMNWETGRSGLPENASIGFYGFYNVEEGEGFSSYQIRFTGRDIVVGVKEAQRKADEISKELQGDHPQTELNFLALDLYNLWDGQLNKIWGYLKETLDPEEMKKLTAEELKWISDKEAKVEKAAGEYKGGSIEPLIRHTTAADITRERVYELLKYVS